MKNKYYLLLLGILMAVTSYGQVTLGTAPGFKPADDFPSDQLPRVKAQLEDLVNKYERLGHCVDIDAGIVTTESANRFAEIFSPTATIVEDYFEFAGNPVNKHNYKNDILRFFEESGFDYSITGANLTNLKVSGRFYFAEISFSKTVPTYVDSRRVIQNRADAAEGCFQLQMNVQLVAEDLNKGFITNITYLGQCGIAPTISPENDDSPPKPPGGGGRPADQEWFASVDALYQVPLWSAEVVDNSPTGFTSDNLDVAVNTALGVEAMVLTNILAPRKSPTKNVFLSLGVGVSYLDWDATVSGLVQEDFAAVAEDDAGRQTPYTRRVGPVNALENNQMYTVTVPVGIGLRLIEEYDRTLHLQMQVVPSLAISQESALTGNGTFDAIYEEADWRALADGSASLRLDNQGFPEEEAFDPYQIGDEVPFSASNELETQLGLGIRLSPSYYHELRQGTPLLGVKVGLDLGFNFTSMLTASPTKERVFANYGDLRNTSSVETIAPNNLSNSFFDSVQMHYVGIRIGIFLRSTNSVNF